MECSGKAIGDWKRGKQISDHVDLGKKMEMSVNGHEVIWRWQKCFQGSLWDDSTALVQLQENCWKKYVERSELVVCHLHPESPILRTHLGVEDVAWWTEGSASMHEVPGPNPSVAHL